MKSNWLLSGCMFLLIATALLAPTKSEAACSTRTPSDMHITPPTANVPDEYAKFSGIWQDGKWDGISLGVRWTAERVLGNPYNQ